MVEVNILLVATYIFLFAWTLFLGSPKLKSPSTTLSFLSFLSTISLSFSLFFSADAAGI